jgi:hypothetical protein
MRIPIRTSRLAIWSRRLASFSAPLLALSIVLHLTGAIASDVFEICLAIASVLAGLAFLFGAIAFVRLWYSSDRGWGKASAGFLLGALCLIPTGYGIALGLTNPSTADVSTDALNPPPLLLREEDVGPVAIDPDAVSARFPNMVSRSYPIDAAALFGLVEGLVQARGWQLLRDHPPRSGAPGVINAEQTTLLGWKNEIGLRVSQEADGAQVVMRAASVRPVHHDLGLNGRLIEDFLVTLDEVVTVYIRDGYADLDSQSDEDLPEVDVEELLDDPEG